LKNILKLNIITFKKYFSPHFFFKKKGCHNPPLIKHYSKIYTGSRNNLVMACRMDFISIHPFLDLKHCTVLPASIGHFTEKIGHLSENQLVTFLNANWSPF
jgi:hypothetical protein